MTDESYIFFYSSETEPEIMTSVGEALSYLKSLNKPVRVVDVFRSQGVAERFNVHATPVLIVKRGDEVKEYFGILSGLKKILRSDLFGKTIIHGMNYRQGRGFAVDHDFRNKGTEKWESVIRRRLEREGITNFTIKNCNKEKCHAEISFVTSISLDHVQTDIAPFLGGIFMEIFGKAVYAKQKNLNTQDKLYEFDIA